MRKASQADRECFARVALANLAFEGEAPPASLEEAFDRLEHIRRSLGPPAKPGVPGDDEGDLEGHLRFLARQREVLSRGRNGA
jgi:hypothetical protein